jgi:hypothetical protein
MVVDGFLGFAEYIKLLVLTTRNSDRTMNFSETIAALNKASAFDLYRLRAAIDRALGEPGWIEVASEN